MAGVAVAGFFAGFPRATGGRAGDEPDTGKGL
jgi:hypothetical protein